MTNYNQTHKTDGTWISETTGTISVGDLRNAIAGYPDDSEIVLGTCECGEPLKIFGFKSRGPKTLQFKIATIDHSERS